jgi:hypothetical protein
MQRRRLGAGGRPWPMVDGDGNSLSSRSPMAHGRHAADTSLAWPGAASDHSLVLHQTIDCPYSASRPYRLLVYSAPPDTRPYRLLVSVTIAPVCTANPNVFIFMRRFVYLSLCWQVGLCAAACHLARLWAGECGRAGGWQGAGRGRAGDGQGTGRGRAGGQRGGSESRQGEGRRGDEARGPPWSRPAADA